MTRRNDFDPESWLDWQRSLGDDVKQRKAEVMAAALCEVGVKARTGESGRVRWKRATRLDPRTHHRAHEIGCCAAGLEPLPFEDWVTVNLFAHPHLADWLTEVAD